jgi:hypothetical protein
VGSQIGELRVYYRVEGDPESRVTILAVGVKDRNRLMAGDQVFDLTGLSANEDNPS